MDKKLPELKTEAKRLWTKKIQSIEKGRID